MTKDIPLNNVIQSHEEEIKVIKNLVNKISISVELLHKDISYISKDLKSIRDSLISIKSKHKETEDRLNEIDTAFRVRNSAYGNLANHAWRILPWIIVLIGTLVEVGVYLRKLPV